MRAAVRPIHLISLAVLLFAASGCTNDCDDMCDAQGAMIERCLDTWGTSWGELSYADQDEFVTRCYAIWGDRLADLDDDHPDYEGLVRQCQTDAEIARSDTDCESLVSIDP